MYETNWNAMEAPQKRRIIGFWGIVICRYIMPIIGVWNFHEPWFALIMIYGGLFLGLVGLGIYIWGITGEDWPTPRKIIAILLSVGIVIGGWIGLVCIVASFISSLISKRKSKQQDDQEATHW